MTMAALVLFAAATWLGGCASSDPNAPLDVDQLARVLKSRGVDPRRVIMPYRLTEEMRLWAEDTAREEDHPLDRLEALRRRLLDPSQMSVTYVWGYTGTAAEVFHNRRANCLAFTNLFLGMAREAGVPVYFVSVDNVESFRKEGDLVVVSDHVAVGVGENQNRLIYDFSENPEIDPRYVRRISDLTAIAMFHSNRGAEALQAGRPQEATAWLRLAVDIDPNLANSWVNLGVAERRLANYSASETAYKRALELNPKIYSAYQNLAALLRHLEQPEEAEAYETALAEAPSHNPYTYLSLGDISLESGRLEDARRFYRRAVGLSQVAEGYAALGEVAVASGDMRGARRLLKKAQKLDQESPRVVTLASALSHGQL